ncbi:phosphoribosylglycinamide formyltransferase [Sutcliffiella rhizosphaerae]|uniref:Phosphoribosylglycinamide formyltransferase n=1 Tax=Sutcliffiella rhizosphaerae TaxID=2880967 RepID=A0ABN8AEU5_9BACI|nr:phosphoribosylglycinamide formyltransferase [Sutcliffiella rhizosphaerae]CAG9621355.1 Phosphoribosylglycinamide formyltransferase [Sutcliffiella rhizosphaerae]
MTTRIAIFASGSGSNFQALVDACRNELLDATPALLVCDKPGAFVVERATSLDIPYFTFAPKSYSSKQEFEKHILSELKSYEVEFIILAGYMRLIGPTLLDAYKGRIVNIHPSLLPAFPGLDAVGQALSYGVKLTGVTIHFVDEGMDTGPIIAQEAITVDPDETKESLEKKIHKTEHTFYPKTLQQIFANKGEAVIK